jgi:DMSO/TMAO reductase YedYZ molybdopterin-dependent catalytic subunit
MIFTHYRNIKTLYGIQLTSDNAAGYWEITPNSVRKKKDALHPESKSKTEASKDARA